LLFLQLV
jgi:hypothetical protein